MALIVAIAHIDIKDTSSIVSIHPTRLGSRAKHGFKGSGYDGSKKFEEIKTTKIATSRDVILRCAPSNHTGALLK